jgi:hypothetical protein
MLRNALANKDLFVVWNLAGRFAGDLGDGSDVPLKLADNLLLLSCRASSRIFSASSHC